MTVNLSGSLMGLSLLTGDSSVFTTAFTSIPFDSKAVRAAKAQFTLAATTPPWKEATATKSASSQLMSILASKTVIDKTSSSTQILPDDIKTSFTAYKALEKLRVLAEAATVKTATAASAPSMKRPSPRAWPTCRAIWPRRRPTR